LNLIRVMPAKGQDNFSMQTSVFLAKLIGPLFLAVGVGLIASAAAYRKLAEKFLACHALIPV
jgi:uncharacterized membrane-anchored protein YitT (DUF2179 family)